MSELVPAANGRERRERRGRGQGHKRNKEGQIVGT
jgi:hypothetical protein